LRLTSEADKQQTVLSRTNRLYQSASTGAGSASSAAEEAAAPAQAALRALAVVEREREALAERRAATERALEACRRRAADLEERAPHRAGLALLLRVHELELEQLALHGERALRRDELRRRDLLLLRYDRQRQLCDEIITRQRRLIEGETAESFFVESHIRRGATTKRRANADLWGARVTWHLTILSPCEAL